MGIGAPEERPVIRLFFELSVRVEQDGELANHPTESRETCCPFQRGTGSHVSKKREGEAAR